MNIALADFSKDLDRLTKLINLSEGVKSFSLFDISTIHGSGSISPLESQSIKLIDDAKDAHLGIAIIPGTLVLYLSGRFEYFVKTVFEDLVIKIAVRCRYFKYLPKEFRENLVSFSAEVIQNPSKYNHGEGAVQTFIKNLHSNTSGEIITDTNSKCLSITSANMRHEVLNDVFNRIGAKEVWTRVGQTPKVQTLFDTGNFQEAQKSATRKLDEIMELRNQIAHPSGSFSWPVAIKILEFINFFRIISETLVDVCDVYLSALTKDAIKKIEEESASITD